MQNLDYTRRDINVTKILEMTCTNVAYLIKLEEYLTAQMLKPFYDNVNKYLHSIRGNDDIVETVMDIIYKRSNCLDEMDASIDIFEDFE